MPGGVNFELLFYQLKRRGYVIYSGQRAIQGKNFRVAIVGDRTEEDMQNFTAVFKEALRELQSNS